MAALLILEPIFESDFLDYSYGFRPGRNAHQALEEIGDHEGFYAYAQYYRATSFFSGTDDSQYSRVPAQFNLNLRAGVLLEDGKYDVSLYANNATNERNYLSQNVLVVPTASGAGTVAQLAPPAMYGVTLRAKF